jgi:hypothetical protein
LAPCQHTVYYPAIETVAEALFSGLKRKVAPNNGSSRQQSFEEDIGAEVHVVMAIYALRSCTV